MSYPDRPPPGEYPPCTAEPCNECPWRREAIPGYLGPHNADEWLAAAHGETGIACHKTIKEGSGWSPRTLQCRGAAIFRANVFKLPRDPSMAHGPQDAERVFTSNAEFKAHHERNA